MLLPADSAADAVIDNAIMAVIFLLGIAVYYIDAFAVAVVVIPELLSNGGKIRRFSDDSLVLVLVNSKIWWYRARLCEHMEVSRKSILTEYTNRKATTILEIISTTRYCCQY